MKDSVILYKMNSIEHCTKRIRDVYDDDPINFKDIRYMKY